MKFIAALLYATAAAAGTGALLDTIVIGVLVFVGTLSALLSISHTINAALLDLRTQLQAEHPPSRTPESRSHGREIERAAPGTSAADRRA